MDNNDLALKLIKYFKKNDLDLCSICKHHIECKEEKCEKYISGVGDSEGKYPDWKWSCLDFEYGECPMRENTPCNKCIENDDAVFELDLEKLIKEVNKSEIQ